MSELLFVEADGLFPYRNQALEEALFETLPADAVALYLWRNDRTVVVGRNQNVLSECNAALLEREGGFVARRISGGGAVYHDAGNLNFTFVAGDARYDVQKQLKVITDAVNTFGIEAAPTGRNDIEAGGRKFSGNAFCRSNGRSLHHGTLLIRSDAAALARYLTPPADKLAARGIASVRARVCTLSQLCAGITTQAVGSALRDSFAAAYGGAPDAVPASAFEADIARRQPRFSSRAWIYAGGDKAENTLRGRFGWGGFELCWNTRGDRMADVRAFSDALETGLFGRIAAALEGVPARRADAAAAVRAVCCENEEQQTIREDAAALLAGGNAL
ncbi:MAG: lipoate--protein ligase [Oscillospiraceae bacterium]|nr:lipoate--protein ligase [Oscillospiraceae bacterium]